MGPEARKAGRSPARFRSQVVAATGIIPRRFTPASPRTGLSVTEDILVVRKGNVLLELQEGYNAPSVSPSEFQTLSKAAVHKL